MADNLANLLQQDKGAKSRGRRVNKAAAQVGQKRHAEARKRLSKPRKASAGTRRPKKGKNRSEAPLTLPAIDVNLSDDPITLDPITVDARDRSNDITAGTGSGRLKFHSGGRKKDTSVEILALEESARIGVDEAGMTVVIPNAGPHLDEAIVVGETPQWALDNLDEIMGRFENEGPARPGRFAAALGAKPRLRPRPQDQRQPIPQVQPTTPGPNLDPSKVDPQLFQITAIENATGVKLTPEAIQALVNQRVIKVIE